MGIVSGERLKQIKQNMVLLDNGEGKEGFVYKYDDLAIKILKHPVYAHQEHGFDFLAASFARTKDDILKVRQIIEERGSKMKIIAKIENMQGINNLEEILDVSDGIMVAR